VAAHRRAARNGHRVSRHQRLEIRGADLHRRHDLRELPDRRTARQPIAAVPGDRHFRCRVPEPGWGGRAAGPQGTAGVESAVVRSRGLAMMGAEKCGLPIRVARVSKVFGEDTDKPFVALKEVSIDIAPGELVSVVGPSGCGKSTLMLMVAGLLERSSGNITIGDQPVTKPITDVGIAFQDHLLLEFRTALANVTLHADIRGLPREIIETRARELFEQLQLTHAMDKYPRQLSGGMRQRVSLIRTLVHDPSVILM